MTSSNLAPRDVTVKEFLDVVMHGRASEAWVTRVDNIDKTDGKEWFGSRFYDNPASFNANFYYALGLIKGKQRTLDNWTAGTLIALDDVGEKTGDDGAAVRACLGDPTFVIQTSKGSQQWGYVLTEAVTDMTLMARMQRALTLKFYPNRRDPGHERVIQYLRLPCGVNNKPKRIAENNGAAWPVRLVEWNPDVRIEPIDVPLMLDDVWAQTEGMSVSASGLSGPRTAAEAQGYGDVILAGLDKLGMVRWNDVSNGYVGVTCPWLSDHHMDDKREGYNPETRHFQCFHTTHGVKTTNDVDEWLEKALGEAAWAELRGKTIGQKFPEIPADQSVYVSGTMRLVPQQPKPAALTWVPIGKGASNDPLPMRRSICSHLARGEVTYRIGAPGMGKSAVSLAYGLAITTDKPALVGEKAFERAGDVLVISNEDTADDYKKRAVGWYRKHNVSRDASPYRLDVNKMQGFVAVTRDDRWTPVRLGEQMAEVAAEIERRGNVCLVILDTQAATFQNVDENDNAAMGRAMALLTQWAKDNDVAVEVIHHGTKSNGRTEGAGELTAARGASAAGGSVRNAVTVTGLTKDQQYKLPPGEGATWLAEDGAKSNHGALSGRKWWQREVVSVTVEDVVDAPGVARTQGVPVYVYKAKGPMVATDPASDEALLVVVGAVCRADADNEPFPVRKPTGSPSTAQRIANASGWADETAEEALKVAEARGMIAREDRDGKPVWAATARGAVFVEKHREAKEPAPPDSVEDDLF